MRREGRCHVRRQDSSDTGTVTTPTTTDTNTNKINPSSATDLTSPGPVVGVRNDGQHRGQRGAGRARPRFAKLSRSCARSSWRWSPRVPVARFPVAMATTSLIRGPAQGRRRAKACGGGRCAPRLPRAERDGPPLRRQGPQNIFALRVRCAEDLLLPPLPAEPLRPIGAAATARPRTRLADPTPEGAHPSTPPTPPPRSPTPRTPTTMSRPSSARNAATRPRTSHRRTTWCPGVRPGYRHVSDRTALCPMTTAVGYRPAEPVEHQVDA